MDKILKPHDAIPLMLFSRQILRTPPTNGWVQKSCETLSSQVYPGWAMCGPIWRNLLSVLHGGPGRDADGGVSPTLARRAPCLLWQGHVAFDGDPVVGQPRQPLRPMLVPSSPLIKSNPSTRGTAYWATFSHSDLYAVCLKRSREFINGLLEQVRTWLRLTSNKPSCKKKGLNKPSCKKKALRPWPFSNAPIQISNSSKNGAGS
jgi:hypothetical protein